VEIRSTPLERPAISALQAAQRRIFPKASDARTVRRLIADGKIPGCAYQPPGSTKRAWWVYTDVPPFTTAAASPTQDSPSTTGAPATDPTLSAFLDVLTELRAEITALRNDNAALRADKLDYDNRLTLLLAAQREKDQAAAELLSVANRYQRALAATEEVLTQIHLPAFGPADRDQTT